MTKRRYLGLQHSILFENDILWIITTEKMLIPVLLELIIMQMKMTKICLSEII